MRCGLPYKNVRLAERMEKVVACSLCNAPMKLADDHTYIAHQSIVVTMGDIVEEAFCSWECVAKRSRRVANLSRKLKQRIAGSEKNGPTS